jgi:hypothetical protein
MFCKLDPRIHPILLIGSDHPDRIRLSRVEVPPGPGSRRWRYCPDGLFLSSQNYRAQRARSRQSLDRRSQRFLGGRALDAIRRREKMANGLEGGRVEYFEEECRQQAVDDSRESQV